MHKLTIIKIVAMHILWHQSSSCPYILTVLGMSGSFWSIRVHRLPMLCPGNVSIYFFSSFIFKSNSKFIMVKRDKVAPE